jgi:hypothetical protein
MHMKEHILAALREQFGRWEELLASLSDEQITAPQLDAGWSIKDVIAHLWAWQQLSVARMQAAVLDREPEFPEWVAELQGDWEEDVDRINAWIYETCRVRPWPEVVRNWREGFTRFLESGEPISEKDLLDREKHPWLEGYSLAFILIASYEHHQEHLEELLAWLREQGTR